MTDTLEKALVFQTLQLTKKTFVYDLKNEKAADIYFKHKGLNMSYFNAKGKNVICQNERYITDHLNMFKSVYLSKNLLDY